MKINEVLLDEGIIDTISSYVPGTASNTAKKASSATQAKIKQVAKAALQKWSSYSQTLTTAGRTPSPQDAAVWFKQFSGADATDLPAGVSPAQINQWLVPQIGNYLAQKTVNTPTAPVAPVAPVASMVGKYKKPAPTQTAATTQSATPAPFTSALGVSVAQASDSGVVLRYKNRNFMLNSQGEWSLDGKDTGGTRASDLLQTEMDKVAKSTGYM
jgi:hypothetical protein